MKLCIKKITNSYLLIIGHFVTFGSIQEPTSLSASLWCTVRMRRLVSTTRTSTMAIDVLKFRPTSIFCSNTWLLLLTSE